MRYATFLSALLHVGALFGGLIIAPFLKSNEAVTETVVPIELIQEAELGEEVSVRADRTEDAVEAEEPEPVQETPPPDPAPQPEPEPILPEPEPEPAQPEPEPEVAQPDPEPEPETPPQREEPKAPEPDPDPLAGLDDVLKDLEDEPDRAPPSEVRDPEGLRNNERIGLGDQLTVREQDLLRSRMVDCYDQLTGVPNAEELVVEVRFRLDRAGEIQGNPEVKNNLAITASGNPYWRATRDRALRAVSSCEPYDYLPQEKYEQWDDVTLRFTPLGVM